MVYQGPGVEAGLTPLKVAQNELAWLQSIYIKHLMTFNLTDYDLKNVFNRIQEVKGTISSLNGEVFTDFWGYGIIKE